MERGTRVIRKLLNTLFVISEENYLALDGETIEIRNKEKMLARFPLHTLEGIISFTYAGASPALMGACAERNIELSFFTPRGKFLARTVGKEYGNVLLRKAQYRISDSEELSCKYARNMIVGKVFNCRWSVERTIRDNEYRVEKDKLKKSSLELKNGIVEVQKCISLESLRGIEGELATIYFSVLDDLILNQKNEFFFRTRNRRPPLDYVNALLSFTYSILSHECFNALSSVGLDSYVGFLHRDRPGRQSLALDLMEEFRGILADRFVLTLINTRAIRGEHFFTQKDGAVQLNDAGRKIFFTAWQTHRKELITHPYLKEKLEWGLVPYTQALLLARTIRGDLEEYPPFLWK